MAISKTVDLRIKWGENTQIIWRLWPFIKKDREGHAQ